MSDKYVSRERSATMTIAPRQAKASACGKAIIVGEHAVVYGAQAIAMPLKQMLVQAELTPRDVPDQTYQTSLKLGGKEVSPRVRGVIDDALALLEVEPFSLTIKGQSTLPIGAGLGSSATLCIVTLRLLVESLGMALPRDTLASLGNRLEARFHGNPSGLDTAVVAYEHCVAFAKGQPIEPINVETTATAEQWHFALIDSGVRASTLAMINVAKPWFQAAKGEQRIARFDGLSKVVATGLARGDFATVAGAMDECGELLTEAGVVPAQLQDMIEEARGLGVLAAKTTGAGGGGAILCLLDPKAASSQIRTLATRFGAHNVYSVSL